jgi:hypothetical protein
MLSYSVIVNAANGSRWYRMPHRFHDYDAALRYAAGMAIFFHRNGAPASAPTISIIGPQRTDTFMPGHLRFIAEIRRWFF